MDGASDIVRPVCSRVLTCVLLVSQTCVDDAESVSRSSVHHRGVRLASAFKPVLDVTVYCVKGRGVRAYRCTGCKLFRTTWCQTCIATENRAYTTQSRYPARPSTLSAGVLPLPKHVAQSADSASSNSEGSGRWHEEGCRRPLALPSAASDSHYAR